MHKISYALIALSLLFVGSFAQAQTAGTITLTANKTAATGSLVPVLTWSTTPVATSCLASGGWSGTKFASGTETLPTITSNKSYTLTCTWGNGTANLSWTAPTKNTNGSTLTDLAGYKVVYGTSTTALTQSKMVNDPNATGASVGSLAAGTWYFAVRSVNSQQAESANSNITTRSITGANAAKTVAITITPPTSTMRTISTRVYDVRRINGILNVGREVGTIALGKPCQSTYRVGSYYRVTNSDVTLKMTPASTSLVVRCTAN